MFKTLAEKSREVQRDGQTVREENWGENKTSSGPGQRDVKRETAKKRERRRREKREAEGTDFNAKVFGGF